MLAMVLRPLHKTCNSSIFAQLRTASHKSKLPRGTEWRMLQLKGESINPCNSPFHPAVRLAALLPSEGEKPIQHSYAAEANCFGCGPHNADGLKLRSFRVKNGLSSKAKLQERHMCFPGIASGGIITTLFDCAGNWTAAIALMDKHCLPRPPLTLTSEIFVNFRHPTPSNEELTVRSQAVSVIESDMPMGPKSQVQVDMELLRMDADSQETIVLATATGIFKKLGALRAL